MDDIPALHDGRIKPLYAIAESSFIQISGSKKIPGQYYSPVHWLLDTSSNTEDSLNAPIFLNTSLEIQKVLNSNNTHLSWNQIESSLPKLYENYLEAQKKNPSTLSLYEKDLQNFLEKVFLFQAIRNTLAIFDHENWTNEVEIYRKSIELENVTNLPSKIAKENEELLSWYTNRYFYLSEAAVWHPLPPEKETKEWSAIGTSLIGLSEKKSEHPLLPAYTDIITAYKTNNQDLFNEKSKEIRNYLKTNNNRSLRKSFIETQLIKIAPFSICMLIYGVIFLSGILYWFLQSPLLWKSILVLTILALTLQSIGIGTRIFLEERPPVTNLYSSAIFISWIAALLGLILEITKPSGMGYTTLGALGGATLLIASKLELGGNTMESLRAVLNSNFWLATHVVIITIGYSATLFAGFLSNLFIIRSLIKINFGKKIKSSWSKTIYHAVFISLFFSFTGTMLGGIWADQSWGRFWGWDPKENGALIIVLWNALILHAKWGGMIKDKGLALLTSLGVITTLLSWFGVNMLGSGLHSYGFMDRAFSPLIITITCQLILTLVGALSINNAPESKPL